MSGCAGCGCALTGDDVGATRKFVDRNATEMFCVACLAEKLKCTEPFLRERIAFLKNNNCSFFPKEPEEQKKG